MLVWYVIQVINGREDVMRERIERMVPAGTMQELFYPQFQTEIKVNGSIRPSRSFPVILSAILQIHAPCNSICCAWTTLPGCLPRTVSLCRWQKKRLNS